MRFSFIVSALIISTLSSSIVIAKKHPKERDVCADMNVTSESSAISTCPDLCKKKLGKKWEWNGNWAIDNDATPPADVTCRSQNLGWPFASVCGCNKGE